jgi:hypothetical protein
VLHFQLSKVSLFYMVLHYYSIRFYTHSVPFPFSRFVISNRSMTHLLMWCSLLFLFLQRYPRLLPTMKMKELVLDLMRLLENLVQMEMQSQLLAKVVAYLLML